MKSLLIVSIAFLGISATAFGDTFALNPTVEVYPPGTATFQCQENGVAPCVFFSGTLTDTDTDGSLLFLNSISVVFNVPADSAYFTLDNTFYNNVPGILSGDPNWATDGNPFSNTYTGPIFGLDIAPRTRAGVYDGKAIISAAGGTSDPNLNGFTEEAQFTLVVTPEHASGLMLLTGLVAIAVSHRLRRAHI